ncbi:hypothetical protein Lal_00021011, partial [Lupinus albus]
MSFKSNHFTFTNKDFKREFSSYENRVLTFFIFQLHSEKVAPNVLSHCLKGDISGGGLLVIGEVVEPYIVYSPLIPKQSHYNLNLENIIANGQMLQIDPEVFKTSSSKGATIDSGTTLAYFIEGAYNSIIDAVSFGQIISIHPI